MKAVVYILFVFFVFSSCQQKSSKELKLSIPKTVKFLGHKGSGPIGNNGNDSLLENTWSAIENAIVLLDGSEIDIQMSADSTLWIFHDHKLLDCEGIEISVGNCSDQKLESISQCRYKNKMLRFEEFVDKSRLKQWGDKTVSLDLKLLYNPVLLDKFKTSKNLSLFIIEKLKSEIKHSSFKVLFEVHTYEQYSLFTDSFDCGVYLVEHQPSKDFLKNEKERETSLSLPHDKLNESDDFFKKQNLQTWTINTPNDFTRSIRFNPNYIQSDNIPLMHFLKSIQNGRNVYNVDSDKFVVGDKVSDFYPFIKSDLPQRNVLVQISSKGKVPPNDFLLTLSAFDIDGQPVHWEGYELNRCNPSYLFINSSFLENKGALIYSINIWNKSLSNFSGEFQIDFFVLE